MNKNTLKAGISLVFAIFGLFYTKNQASAVIYSVEASPVSYTELSTDGQAVQAVALSIKASDARNIDKVYVMVNRPRSKNAVSTARGSFQWNASSTATSSYGIFQMTPGSNFGQQYVNLLENGPDGSNAVLNPLNNTLEVKFRWQILPNYGYFGQNVISYYVHDRGGSATGWRELTDAEQIFVAPGYPRLGVSVDANLGAQFMARPVHLGDQGVEVVKFRLSATGAEDINVKSLRSAIFVVPATDDVLANLNTLRNFRLMSGGRQIGQTQDFANPEITQSATCQLCINAVTFALSEGDLLVKRGASVSVSVVADVASEADGGVPGAQFQGATGFVGRFSGPALSAVGDITSIAVSGYDHLGKRLLTEGQPMTSKYSLTVAR